MYPLISIIIPTYNRREFLQEAVTSCLNQTWPNLEIIIVDDGSLDGTQSVVESRLKGEWKGRNVRYVLQDNAGASAARNRGLALAKGDYVQFLDSDDELLPGKLLKQVEFLESPDNVACQMCYSFGHMGQSIDGNGVRVGREATSTKELILRLVSREVHVLSTPAPLWRRSFLVQFDGWNPQIGLGDDLEYYVRLVCSMDHFGFIPEELFFVRKHDGPRLGNCSMSAKMLKSAVLTQELIQQTILEAGCWVDIICSVFLKRQGSLYINVLRFGTIDCIRDFELWFMETSKNCFGSHLVACAILGRRCFGKGLILFLFDFFKYYKSK